MLFIRAIRSISAAPCGSVSKDKEGALLIDRHNELTEQIIKAFYQVYNTLGYGFSEKVYENALALELVEMGLAWSNRKGSPCTMPGKW